MGDNLCGPSNALQNFQKHSNVDRTLQQDRLVGRASSSQGFRTSPGPNAGQLDAEFAAFQGGHQSLGSSPAPQSFSHLPHLPHYQTPPPQFNQHVSPQHSAGQGWATDFQNMSISGPPAQFQQGLHQSNQSQIGGWHQEFAQSQSNSGLLAQGNQPVMGMNHPSMMSHGYNPMPRVLMQQNQLTSTGQTSMEHTEVFDDAAFERAFEAAANTQLEQEQAQEQESARATSQHEATMISEQTKVDQQSELARSRATNDLLNQAPLGADTIQDSATATSQEIAHAPDDLARTAGDLVASVSSNQSDKFQNSQFLQLMRQFRDKEATVQGDKVVNSQQGVYENTSATLANHNSDDDKLRSAAAEGNLATFIEAAGKIVGHPITEGRQFQNLLERVIRSELATELKSKIKMNNSAMNRISNISGMFPGLPKEVKSEEHHADIQSEEHQEEEYPELSEQEIKRLQNDYKDGDNIIFLNTRQTDYEMGLYKETRYPGAKHQVQFQALRNYLNDVTGKRARGERKPNELRDKMIVYEFYCRRLGRQEMQRRKEEEKRSRESGQSAQSLFLKQDGRGWSINDVRIRPSKVVLAYNGRGWNMNGVPYKP